MDDVRNSGAGGAGLMDKLRNGATSQLDAQKDRATDGIGTVAQAVRQSAQQLRDSHHETMAQYVEQAVGQVERVAGRLKEKDAGELMRDAQQFARRNPAVFIGAAFAVGMVAARFLKSSGGTGNGNGDSWRDRTATPALPYGSSAFGSSASHGRQAFGANGTLPDDTERF